MKKLFALILAVVMLASLCACTKDTGNTESDKPNESGMPNPITECASLTEVNAAAGSKFVKPGDDVKDEKFMTIAGEPVVGQYIFTLNGNTYTWRSAKTTEDITGIYEDAIDSEYPNSNDEPAFKTTENYNISFWLADQTIQYALTAPADVKAESFKAVTYMLVALTVNKVSYSSLAGNYMDTVGQRASAVVIDNGDDATVIIQWANSVSSYNDWTMNVKYEDGKLVYSNCENRLVSVDENGAPVETETVYTDGEGYFELVENRLNWTGAADEQCQKCVFEKFGSD